jgi:hypothetical protein
MKTCYRCGNPIIEATTLESPRGERHYYNCPEKAPEPVVPEPAPPVVLERIVVKTITSDPIVIETFNRTKAIVVALVAALAGATATAIYKTFL